MTTRSTSETHHPSSRVHGHRRDPRGRDVPRQRIGEVAVVIWLIVAGILALAGTIAYLAWPTEHADQVYPCTCDRCWAEHEAMGRGEWE